MKCSLLLTVGIVCAGGMRAAVAAEPIDFSRQVKPILESACLGCHGAEKPKGGLRLDTRSNALKGGSSGAVLVPGKPEASPLLSSTLLPADDDSAMPPGNVDRLTKEQTDVLKAWIEQGAAWPEDVTLKQAARIKFAKDIQPILELNCVACHRADYKKGGLRLDNKSDAFKGGHSGAAIVPFDTSKSLLYTSTAANPDDEQLMPPKAKNGPLPKEQIELLREWIAQGASWPEGITNTPKKIDQVAAGDNAELVAKIHKRILAKLTETKPSDMKTYTNEIPGFGVNYAMVAIPEGEFLMGSPENEPDRKPDEGPQHRVKISPFWMGQYEVNWDQYQLFMYAERDKESRKNPATPEEAEARTVSDAVSTPTKPYVDMTFGMGKRGYPAISMTQHAANKYCQWLSALTGHFYRLPTEAEWEFACRAGSTTAYSFGNDTNKLSDYGWFLSNSLDQYQRVGKKKPNAWGLYDMHGNVVEWVIDQYAANYYESFAGKVATDPWNVATTSYPHAARGGSWNDPPDLLRSAARLPSGREWKRTDPQMPKSIWYHTDAQWLGFRIVRPLKVPPVEVMAKYWNSGVEKD